MNASEYPKDTLLQVLLYLSTDTIKDNFYHLGGKVGEFSDQKKWTVASEIVQKCGQSILRYRAFVL